MPYGTLVDRVTLSTPACMSLRALLELALRGAAHPRPGAAVARVEEHALPGLGIFHVDPPGIGELALPGVVDRDRDHVVVRRQLPQWLLPPFGPEVREDDDDRAVARQLRRVPQ